MVVTRTTLGTGWDIGGFRTIGEKLKHEELGDTVCLMVTGFKWVLLGLVGSIGGAICATTKRF